MCLAVTGLPLLPDNQTSHTAQGMYSLDGCVLRHSCTPRIDVSLALTWAYQQGLKKITVHTAQWVDYLPSLCETMGLILSVA